MKTTSIAKRVDKLKEVVMNLHRSAGQLDQMIQSIENELYGREEIDKDFLKVFIKSQEQYRKDFKTVKEYHTLDEREEFYWEKLIQAIEKGS